MKIKTLKHISTLVLLVALSLNLSAQDWEVPAKKAKKENPSEYNDALIKKGKAVYNTNCKSCHGDAGMNNGLPLVPKPEDPLSTKFQSNSDGELYYKITEGRIMMPSFKAVLSDEDRWAVVAYSRSINPDYKPAKKEVAQKAAPKKIVEVIVVEETPKDIEIILQADRGECVVIATAYGINAEGKSVPVKNAEIEFAVKRYFGNLTISEDEIETDEFGVAKITFPEDLPGGEDGNIEMIVRLLNEDKYGQVTTTQTVDIAKISVHKDMTEERALWNTRDKTPVWLLFIFFALVIGVWGGIFYIVKQIMTLRKLG